MHKGRGKGKISNDLVAAGCAAVLAVYAAGYLRTRDAARRFESEARQRRVASVIAAPAPPTALAPKAVAQTASAPLAAPQPSLPLAAHKPARRKAAASMAAAASTPQPVLAEPASPSGPREIAPVPMPTEESAGPKPIAIARGPASASAARWRDGTYTGLGDSPHGDIEARVVIKDGRIIDAGIATCDTRYPCSVIDALIHQPVERQSPDVDYMSHATESSDAYYYALVAALENAREQSSSEATIPK